MTLSRYWVIALAALFATSANCVIVKAHDTKVDWKKAGDYLDQRQKAWFEFAGADRGTGLTKTSCLCCHTIVPYALARPVLRNSDATASPTDYEVRLIRQVHFRVEYWNRLDERDFGLLYSANLLKQRESWGTEAVLNAVILAFDDRHRNRTEASDRTRMAFANMWNQQRTAGSDCGSWDWLTFGLEPWESKNSRYYGAALAAIAVGTAPGYYRSGVDAAIDAKVHMLRNYLRSAFANQSLYNRIWCLWASRHVDNVLTLDQQKILIEQVFAKQRDDGGWNLASLGPFVRVDRTAPDATSDGYATGLILHVLQTVGVRSDHPGIVRGRSWLQLNQLPEGNWPAMSVNKKRNPQSHSGKFMADAATAFAVLALMR